MDELERALSARPAPLDPETGLRPPPGFSEEEMDAANRAFLGMAGGR